ncbi:MAG: SDR family NAD(P)-dependent oxidoreductase [Bacteroidetes bacterium]|nr:SDR family NAD(P)-dependent oxidoreductase [Bacteroidota bacterium]
MYKLAEKNVLVTGGAGFIGSHIVDKLLERDNMVIAYDNLSSGYESFIAHNFNNSSFTFIKKDLADFNTLNKVMKDIDFVFHLAANPDIRYGVQHTDWDLKQNTLTTYNVLEAMRINGKRRIAFASTSACFGSAENIPTPENYGIAKPESLYGASKLAGEGLISAFVHTFGFQTWIYRFSNIIGDRGVTHMVLVDFIRKLTNNPKELEILGNGKQSKPLLLVQDCVDAMLFIVENSMEKLNIYNIAPEDRISSITKIAEVIIEEMELKNATITYTGGEKGWPGDVPVYQLSNKKLKSLGWEAKYTSEEALRIAVKILVSNTENQYGISFYAEPGKYLLSQSKKK